MLGVEVDLALVEAGDLALQRGELLLGRARPGRGPRPAASLSRPISASPGLQPGARGADLAGQPGQPLAPVGRGPLARGDPPLLRGERLLGRRAGGHGRGQPDPRPARPAARARPPRRGPRAASASSSSGSRPGRSSSVSSARQPHPLGRQRRGAAQPLAQPGQPEPGLLGRGQRRAPRRPSAASSVGLPGLRRGQLGLDLAAPLAQRGLVGDLLLRASSAACSRSSASSRSRASRRSAWITAARAGHLGLPAQRLELAAQLGGEVLQPGEVGLHRVELAQRLLLALAVLEDAGGLLDEAAAVLGRRRAGSCRAGPGRR